MGSVRLCAAEVILLRVGHHNVRPVPNTRHIDGESSYLDAASVEDGTLIFPSSVIGHG